MVSRNWTQNLIKLMGGKIHYRPNKVKGSTFSFGVNIPVGDKMKLFNPKIKRVANASSGECYLFYTVPPFIIGLPRYDLSSCKYYIVQKLKSNGFRVINLDKSFLFISWQHIQFDRLKEQQMEEMIHRINNGIPLITENTNNNQKSFKSPLTKLFYSR